MSEDTASLSLIALIEAAKNEPHPLDSDFDRCIEIVRQHMGEADSSNVSANRKEPATESDAIRSSSPTSFPSEISVIDDKRAEFERWAQSKKLPINISDHFITAGAYAHQDTHVAWLAWQARGEIAPVSSGDNLSPVAEQPVDCRTALEELVFLKDNKGKTISGDEYYTRKGPAWDRARTALAATPKRESGHLPTCDLRKDIMAGCSCGYWKDENGNPIRFAKNERIEGGSE